MVFSIINSADSKYQQVLQLRNEVLRKPLGLSLFDENLNDEKNELIFILENDNELIACCMLKKISTTIFKLRQMAVKSNFQGKGNGQKLIAFVEHYANENKIQCIELHARVSALSFYKNLEYQFFGEEFEEVGIPHLKMKKNIFIE